MKCPRCGQDVKMISGIKCPKCDHVSGSQNLDHDWKQFEPELGRFRARDADRQARPDKSHHPRRRHPLDFK